MTQPLRHTIWRMSDTPRIEALEFKCAYLERATQELSDVIHRQQQELDKALARIDELARQIEALEMTAENAVPMDARTETPPHF